jgi:predicted negative regulator of RcsB-dependent stress response
MTTPNTRSASRLGSDESLTDWFLQHKREASWVFLALVFIVGGLWYFQRSRSLREQHAEKAYFQARQAAAAGNLPLAVSDLKKVVTRYEGTSGGTLAAIFLAQALYEQKKPQEGITELKRVLADAPKDFAPSIHALIANGHEELKDFGAAAVEYKAASAATRFAGEKASYLAAAGRAYMAAGKPAEARAIWAELAEDETGPMAAEARVRLGEIDARAMTT